MKGIFFKIKKSWKRFILVFLPGDKALQMSHST